MDSRVYLRIALGARADGSLRNRAHGGRHKRAHADQSQNQDEEH